MFGPHEKRAYEDIFQVSSSTVSRHQAAFTREVSRYLGEGIVLHDKGKLFLADAGELPEQPLFELPPLERWLEDVMRSRFVRHSGVTRARPKPHVLRSIIASIRRRQVVEILYASRTREEPSRRLLSVHRLVEISGRHHVRAFDHMRNRYADFVLSRMIWCRLVDGAPFVEVPPDSAWNEIVIVEVLARENDPRLGVRMDFGLDETGRRFERVSRALADYFVDAPREGYLSPVVVRRAGHDDPG